MYKFGELVMSLSPLVEFWQENISPFVTVLNLEQNDIK